MKNSNHGMSSLHRISFSMLFKCLRYFLSRFTCIFVQLSILFARIYMLICIQFLILFTNVDMLICSIFNTCTNMYMLTCTVLNTFANIYMLIFTFSTLLHIVTCLFEQFSNGYLLTCFKWLSRFPTIFTGFQ